MGREEHKVKALNMLRGRICDSKFIFLSSADLPDSNYSKLKFMISSSITEGNNNSMLLLGPRGSGKIAVLDLVLEDMSREYPDTISVIRLNGFLHNDDTCSFKEIARQLCMEHHLLFSKMASFDDNSKFLVAMLKECGLAHKTIIFILDEFDQFTQGKQRLLYSLLDAMQSIKSQAVVIGVSCRMDADQLLEKRVRSRFSHRKLLFLPPSLEDSHRLLENILTLPEDPSLPHGYVVEFNKKLHKIIADARFKEIMNKYFNCDTTVKNLLRFLFSAVSRMDLESGFLSLKNFETALASIQREPKLDAIRNCSVLELYILVCLKSLEVKEQNLCNFISVMKEYKRIHDSIQTSDCYAQNVCLRAFEHLIQRELISFTDSRGLGSSVEYRPVKLLISHYELHQGLETYPPCPVILQQVMDGKV